MLSTGLLVGGDWHSKNSLINLLDANRKLLAISIWGCNVKKSQGCQPDKWLAVSVSVSISI